MRYTGSRGARHVRVDPSSPQAATPHLQLYALHPPTNQPRNHAAHPSRSYSVDENGHPLIPAMSNHQVCPFSANHSASYRRLDRVWRGGRKAGGSLGSWVASYAREAVVACSARYVTPCIRTPPPVMVAAQVAHDPIAYPAAYWRIHPHT